MILLEIYFVKLKISIKYNYTKFVDRRFWLLPIFMKMLAQTFFLNGVLLRDVIDNIIKYCEIQLIILLNIVKCY